MKIRLGFVSNSSSTSFCIYGLSLDKEKDNFDNMETAVYEYNNGKKPHERLEICSFISCSDWLYVIGFEPQRMQMIETLQEFKDRLDAALATIGISEEKRKEITWHIDGGYQ